MEATNWIQELSPFLALNMLDRIYNVRRLAVFYTYNVKKKLTSDDTVVGKNRFCIIHKKDKPVSDP